ncbi:type II CAAX endopeptidase family protein [Clostridium sp.]|uniref:CPBP family intramembrane glutamic endopeptidase n=1 Tax=Clostridium sp. TaxID=1506 RepID=UPI00283DF4D3|nr:type II CAAX endopeptidase family protein [Clostridium sp.]MDR3593621.1 type II CAAX endopeptidase family protein [Clostridium sp.]
MKERSNLLIISFTLMGMIILSVALGNFLGGIGNYFFYQIIYCVVISVCIPIYYFRKEDNGDVSLLGIKKLRFIDYAIIIGFLVFSLGGSLKSVKFQDINFALLPLSIAPLILTTFSEEFFFRGFLQIRFEKAFGTTSAIIVSGLTFGTYHLGYPGFRSIEQITTLFFVGIMFALSFKLSKNNVIVSYFVNLPNAYLQYLLKTQQFPYINFTKQATIITIFLIVITGFIVLRGLNIKKINLKID